LPRPSDCSIPAGAGGSQAQKLRADFCEEAARLQEGKSEEEDFCRTKNEIIETIKRAKDDIDIPFAVFKVTGIAPLGTLEKVSSGTELTDKGEWKWRRIEARVDEICKLAHALEQPVFIDAEDSWIQNAIDRLANSMMEKYNLEEAIVYNTIQMYRTAGFSLLQISYERAVEKDSSVSKETLTR